mmetsp:Transcript_16080/g.35078  ORF Transcript_16080/g.35078 Transcript_16080/m.35078 type:complete len:241 (-) Transcript_16080:159-881(-)
MRAERGPGLVRGLQARVRRGRGGDGEPPPGQLQLREHPAQEYPGASGHEWVRIRGHPARERGGSQQIPSLARAPAGIHADLELARHAVRAAGVPLVRQYHQLVRARARDAWCLCGQGVQEPHGSEEVVHGHRADRQRHHPPQPHQGHGGRAGGGLPLPPQVQARVAHIPRGQGSLRLEGAGPRGLRGAGHDVHRQGRAPRPQGHALRAPGLDRALQEAALQAVGRYGRGGGQGGLHLGDQ